MAFNLSASLKSSFTTVSNSIKTTVNTVSQDFTAASNRLSQGLSSATGLSTQKVNSALLGGAAGALLGGNKGALFGAVAGGALGDGGFDNLLGQVKNKLGGLIDSAEELQGLVNNPLKIIERGVADLAGLTGEEYGVILAQFRELSERSAFTDFVDSGFMPSYKGDDSSASKLPNPLRNHNGVNYVISLGVLGVQEYNNPELYRSAGGFKNYVIQSSGGNLGKRYQVFDEKGSGKGEHAEYYIDDLELDAVIAPNKNTRVTVGTALSFTVTEPYSMGNFIQAIIGAASDAGYKTYHEAPFCLKIDFAGWNLDGSTDANFLQRPMFIPIKFVNMDFNVSGQGSKYQVKAIPMSETGLADNVNKINTSIRARGVLCHQVLETNDNSVTGGINKAIEALEEAGALAPYDRYIICFPKTRQEISRALQTGTITETAFTTSPEEQEEQRRGTLADNPEVARLNPTYNPTPVVVTQPTRTYSILKTFAENTNLMNEIGLSPINEDTNAPGNTSEADAQAATNPETGLVDTTSQAAQPATVARDHQFNQGQTITSIIERMVLQTKFCAENATKKANNGLHKWFRIDTHVFIDEGDLTEATMGRKPKVYVYSIIPYEVDEAVVTAGNKRAGNTKGLRESAVKEYNYIYSGKNEDVLNFDINFNNAFLMTANANFGMNTGTLADTNQGTVAATQTNADSGATAAQPGDLSSRDDPGGATGFTDRVAEPTGTQSNDIRRQIAEMFHDRITNMNVDMVTAEMELMGDPFFIPQQTGNYVARPGSKPNLTEDGTMNYLDSSVFCIVNFRTPFDYQIKGATMEFPQIVPGFSGLFQVWAVTSRFSGAKFTQTLKMIRRTGQDDPATTGSSGFVQTDNAASISNTTTQSDGTVGQSGMPSTDCMPAPVADDIRNLMPAVADDVAAALTAQVKAIESSLVTGFEGIAEAVQLSGPVPDLTKVIPRIASAVGGGLIGNALGGRLGAVAGVALGAQLGTPGGLNNLAGSLTSGLSGLGGSLNSAVNSLNDPNAPPYTGDDPIIRARLGLPAVNTSADQGVAAVSNRPASAAASQYIAGSGGAR
jgi:hypothetical protein